MEHITEPWQVIVLIVVAVVAGTVIVLWLYTGSAPNAEPEVVDPGMLIQSGWAALLHWRPVPKAITPPEPEPARSNEIPLLNGVEPRSSVPEPNANPAELQLNASEVSALHRMIEHNKTAAKPSKSSTIQAGFGVSRGGSAAYVRASVIYDTLFGAPAPAVQFRELKPEQEALRQQLHLDKH